jgi:hypothetical protein
MGICLCEIALGEKFLKQLSLIQTITKMTGESGTSFPEEKWIKRIPFLIMGYSLGMLLLGNAVSGSSNLVQHIYVYSFGLGFIFLVALFTLLWRKYRISVIRNDGNNATYKRQ